MRIALVGGGTGGHFYPLIAVAEALIDEAGKQGMLPPELYYFGPDQYDAEALGALGIKYVPCPAGKLRRYFSLRNFADMFRTAGGFFVALFKLFILYPNVVFSKGGYTSVPVILAARLLFIPIVIHESDIVPGRANKLAMHFARYIAVTYPEAVEKFPIGKASLTGLPVRKLFHSPAPANPLGILKITSPRPLLLVLGGSQGAEKINNAVLSTLRELLETYEILHQTGKEHVLIVNQTAEALLTKELHQHYHTAGFLEPEEYKAALEQASIVISRAGTGGIYDIAFHAKPSILIPIPEDVSHDQRKNAYSYASGGAAVVIEEQNLSPNVLMSEVTRIMSDRTLQATMAKGATAFVKRDASQKLAEMLLSIGREQGE